MKQYVKQHKIESIFIFMIFVITSAIFIYGMSKSAVYSIFEVWDNEHYITIAKEGYSKEKEYLTAFFPMIPLLILLLSKYGLLVVNGLAFLFSMYLFNMEMVEDTEMDVVSRMFTVLTFASSPLNLYSKMMYTESIFVLLTLLVLRRIRHQQFDYKTGILLGLMSFTRNVGSLFFISIFIVLFYMFIRRKVRWQSIVEMYIPATIISCIYPAYLQIKFGNWSMFIDAQKYWSKIKTNPIDMIKIVWDFAIKDTYDAPQLLKTNEYLTIIFFIMMLVSMALIGYRIWKQDIKHHHVILLLYGILNLLVIMTTIKNPTLGAPTVSAYRYLLSSMILFFGYAYLWKPLKLVMLSLTIMFSCIITPCFMSGFFFF